MRKQLGWRLPKLLVNQFSELCRGAEVKPSEVVEDFMRRAVDVGSVVEALSMIEPRGRKVLLARELKARALIASIRGNLKDEMFFYKVAGDYQELLRMLPMLQDAELIEEVKKLSVEVNKALRE